MDTADERLFLLELPANWYQPVSCGQRAETSILRSMGAAGGLNRFSAYTGTSAEAGCPRPGGHFPLARLSPPSEKNLDRIAANGCGLKGCAMLKPISIKSKPRPFASCLSPVVQSPRLKARQKDDFVELKFINDNLFKISKLILHIFIYLFYTVAWIEPKRRYWPPD